MGLRMKPKKEPKARLDSGKVFKLLLLWYNHIMKYKMGKKPYGKKLIKELGCD